MNSNVLMCIQVYVKYNLIKKNCIMKTRKQKTLDLAKRASYPQIIPRFFFPNLKNWMK